MRSGGWSSHDSSSVLLEKGRDAKVLLAIGGHRQGSHCLKPGGKHSLDIKSVTIFLGLPNFRTMRNKFLWFQLPIL